MSSKHEVRNLEQLLDRIGDSAKDRDQVSLGAILEAVGGRSFAPLLIVAGLLALAPGIGDIPGVPTLVAVLVVLTAGQLLFGRNHLWLPQWLLKRSVSRDKLCKALGWLRPPSRFIDRLLRPRLVVLTQNRAIAIACLLIAAALPAMEVIPFSANGAGLALTAFGLALVVHDGLMALLAFGATALTLGLGIYYLL